MTKIEKSIERRNKITKGLNKSFKKLVESKKNKWRTCCHE